MLQPSQLKKKIKTIAQMVPLICSGSEKNIKLPLKLPKRTLSTPVQCLSLYPRARFHSLWPCIALWVVWTCWGGGRAHLCKKGIALEYWITSTHYNANMNAFTLSFVQSFKTQVDPEGPMSTTCLQNVIRKLIVGGSWSSKAPWSPGI